MFRGYAGSSESDFPEEVASEQALARGEWLSSFEGDASELEGRATAEATRRLSAWDAAIRFAGKIPENPAQYRRLVREFDPHIYRGAMVTCIYDPDKALCRRRVPDMPDFATCEPLRCGNAVFTVEDVASWKSRAEELLELSHDPSAPPAVQGRAGKHAASLLSFFDRLERSRDTDA